MEKVQSATPEELKKSEAEERRNALRIALARRMKQDLLESSNTDESNFKFQQVRNDGYGLFVNLKIKREAEIA